MSYLEDKEECKGCKLLFDTDLLNRDSECRDCQHPDEDDYHLEEIHEEDNNYEGIYDYLYDY